MKIQTLKQFIVDRDNAVRAHRKVVTMIGTKAYDSLPDPLIVYATVLGKSKRSACLLESATHSKEQGRYSFVCVDGKPFAATSSLKGLRRIKQQLREQCPMKHSFLPFVGGALGYVGHEVVTLVEKSVKPHKKDPFRLPYVGLQFMSKLMIFDHKEKIIYFVTNVSVEIDPLVGYEIGSDELEGLERCLNEADECLITSDVASVDEIVSNTSEDEFKEMVLKAKDHICRGDVFQVVLSRKLSVSFQGQGLSLYRSLRSINPSTYLFHMRFDDSCGNATVVGSSPEIMTEIIDGTKKLRPLAGTNKRGKTPEEDKQNAKDLLADVKEVAEHRMLIDLARNDIGKWAVAETVMVTKCMEIERYSHVMHISSEVVGKLRPGISPFDAFLASLVAGTLSGAPKIEALNLIAQLEASGRGAYGGAFGWFTDTDLDTCIFIRSGIIIDGTFHFQTGAGIVYDSDPDKEYAETEMKAAAMKKAIANMNQSV